MLWCFLCYFKRRTPRRLLWSISKPMWCPGGPSWFRIFITMFSKHPKSEKSWTACTARFSRFQCSSSNTTRQPRIFLRCGNFPNSSTSRCPVRPTSFCGSWRRTRASRSSSSVIRKQARSPESISTQLKRARSSAECLNGRLPDGREEKPLYSH